MDRLIHQHAAAIERPGAPPRAAVVILLRAPPQDVRVPQHEAAEGLFFHQRAHPHRGGIEAVLADHCQIHAGLALRLQHALHGGARYFHGLLHDDVPPTFHDGNGVLTVHAAGRADIDDVQVRAGQFISARLPKGCSPNSRASDSALSTASSATATNSASARPSMARACTFPMIPHPTIPNCNGFSILHRSPSQPENTAHG